MAAFDNPTPELLAEQTWRATLELLAIALYNEECRNTDGLGDGGHTLWQQLPLRRQESYRGLARAISTGQYR
jgi:hypothetical protein